MDWLGIQQETRRYLEQYFFSRNMTLSRIESARNKDIGEQAKEIDAAIRVLVRENRHVKLNEDEKDILAIRLHWAWQQSIPEAVKPFENIEIETEENLETVLIELWEKDGKKTYKPFSLNRPMRL